MQSIKDKEAQCLSAAEVRLPLPNPTMRGFSVVREIIKEQEAERPQGPYTGRGR